MIFVGKLSDERRGEGAGRFGVGIIRMWELGV